MILPVIPDPSIIPGGEHSVQATPTRLQADNRTPMRKVTMRSALGNDIIYFGLSDIGQRKRRGYLLAGESITLTYPAMTPETIWLYGTEGDVVFWDSPIVETATNSPLSLVTTSGAGRGVIVYLTEP